MSYWQQVSNPLDTQQEVTSPGKGPTHIKGKCIYHVLIEVHMVSDWIGSIAHSIEDKALFTCCSDKSNAIAADFNAQLC